MSLRGRLLAASLVLVALGLFVVGTATYIAFRSFLLHQVDAQLIADAQSLQKANFRNRSVALGLVYVVYLNADGTPVQAPNLVPKTPPPSLPANLPVANDLTTATPHTLRSQGRGWPRYRVLAAPASALDPTITMVVGIPLTDEANDLARLVTVELLVGVAVLLAAAMVGSWLVRLGLRPLQEIETTAESIAASDLTERVAVDDERTEVGRLGRTLNAMLARIEAAFEEQRRSEEALRASEERLRRFVSDASHELRTPVAAVRANAELFRRGGENHPEDLPRLMARIESEAARMGVLVEDLLLLTRLDQGRALEQAPVDLGALAAEAVEAARVIEPDRPITLTVSGSVEVLGDKDRLRQVIDNLLTNIRRHTPAGTPGWVSVAEVGTGPAARAILEVADGGPGIDPDDGARIFERFYRADTSRSRDRGGSGLGLSIVAAITAAHGGLASATNRPEGGALFRIDLPALVEAARPEPMADDDGEETGPETATGGPGPAPGNGSQPPETATGPPGLPPIAPGLPPSEWLPANGAEGLRAPGTKTRA
ncbi:MAG TPA: ATP-binding protein [Actinomycetota bacterium]|nr:ATP-binding protein [Actinomycetota bacterium]